MASVAVVENDFISAAHDVLDDRAYKMDFVELEHSTKVFHDTVQTENEVLSASHHVLIGEVHYPLLGLQLQNWEIEVCNARRTRVFSLWLCCCAYIK